MTNAANDKIPVFNVQDAPYSAPTNGTDATTAITSALTDAAAAANGTQGTPVVFFPAGVYSITQISVPAGVILQGVHSSAYGVSGGNMDQPGWPVSMLKQAASQNKDAVVFADTKNYQRVYDLGLDGNKWTSTNTTGNTSGRGWTVADGTNGQESQVILERVFAFNCAESGIYLGKNRRANKVLNCVSNYAGQTNTVTPSVGDGITVAGSDNTIQGCIFGSNARAGICLGTTTALRWASFGSNNASAVTHVFNNDIYQNLVGISVGNGSWGSLLMGNGIDRNSNEGIAVYSGYDTSVQMNCFHSNGVATDNTYPHVGLGSGVTQIAVSGNDFGPQDGNESNKASYCVFKSGGIGATTVVGDYGTENTAGGTPNITSAHNFHN